MERCAPAHCCCVPGSLTSFSSTSPQVLLLFFQLPASTSGLQPTISLCKRMCSETRSYACQALMTIRLNLFEGSNKTTTTTTNKKKLCLTAEFIQILMIQILFGNVYRCFFMPYLPDFISNIHAYEVI